MGMPGAGGVQNDARLRGVAVILLRCKGVKEKQLVQRDAARRRRTKRGLRVSFRHRRDRVRAPNPRLPSPPSSFMFQLQLEQLQMNATWSKSAPQTGQNLT